jgi:hypothetical protein
MSEEQAKYTPEPLNPDDVLDEFVQLDQAFNKLKERRDQLLKKVLDFSDMRVFIAPHRDGNWTRVKIVDHVADFMNGRYYVPTRVERYEVKIDHLKNKPKELVELEKRNAEE